MPNAPFDLKARARQAMLDAGFKPDFPPEVMREVQALQQDPSKAAAPSVRDLRSLLWSSIDNDTSRDLDQVEYVEPVSDGAVRLLVGIADVDSSVSKDSATDRQAGAETTSVYTGIATFPMLPAICNIWSNSSPALPETCAASWIWATSRSRVKV